MAPAAGRAGAAEPPLAWLLWSRFTWRHWRLAPVQTVTLLLILALGIAVFGAMRLANRAVLASFSEFTALVAQESDWVLTSPAGTLPESTLPEVRRLLGARAVALVPMLEITGTEPLAPGAPADDFGTRRACTILGVDVVAMASLASTLSDGAEEARWQWNLGDKGRALLGEPNAAWIAPALAARHGVAEGGTLRLLINDREQALRVVGVLPARQGRFEMPPNLVLMDLPAVQRLGQVPGRIDRVEGITEPGADAARVLAESRQLLAQHAGERWILSTPGDRRVNAQEMSAALRLNLSLLSTLALVVGVYFIYQALDGAVVRRRAEIATMRALGVPERAVRRAWLVEAAVLGLAGGVLGGLLGWAGAQGAVQLVSRTVNALYQASETQGAPFRWEEFALAVTLGVAFSLSAGWFPAREAARTPPAQAVRRHAGTVSANARWWPGVVLLVVAVGAALLPPVPRVGGGFYSVGGYLSTFASVLAASWFVGPLLARLARWLQPWSGRSALLAVALSQLRRPTLRHAIAAACLLSAVAMAGGMVVLVGSYDFTMRGWLNRTFQGDLYLSSEGAQSASATNRLPPETWRTIAQRPEVETYYAVQAAPIVLRGLPTIATGVDLPRMRPAVQMAWMHEPPEAFFHTETNAQMAMASEAFVRRYQLRVGERFELPTPAGPQPMELVGIFADYGNERGSVWVDRAHFARWWGHELLANLTLKLRPGVSPETMRAELRAQHPGLTVYTNRALREQALRIFGETFSVTYALELIAVVVAVTGLGLTLASIFLQRRADLVTLRALAWTPREIALTAATEGVLLAVVGLVVGLLLSLWLGVLLVYVVNRQSFGWTLQYHVPPLPLLLLSGAVLLAGAGAAYVVGRWAARLPADREEEAA